MIKTNCAVGRGCRAEIFKISFGVAVKLRSYPFVKPLDERNILHNLHTDCGAENLSLGLFGCFNFNNPGCLSSLVGNKSEIRNSADY